MKKSKWLKIDERTARVMRLDTKYIAYDKNCTYGHYLYEVFSDGEKIWHMDGDEVVIGGKFTHYRKMVRLPDDVNLKCED